MNKLFARSWVRWSSYVLIAVLFAIACGFLSHWQFSRNSWRAAQLQLVQDNYNAAAIPLSQVTEGDGQLIPDKEWHPVRVSGVYDTALQTVVRNRVHNGNVSFEVLTPLRLADGRIFIVDRGWVLPAAQGDGPATIPPPPAGEVTVLARVRPSEALPSSGRGAPPGQVPVINLPLIAERTGATTITGFYGQLMSETPSAASQPLPFEAPDNDPGPYLSYAVQWILFAVMGFGFIFSVIRTERRRRREDADEAAGRERVASRSERRRSDAEIEDAILDAAEH